MLRTALFASLVIASAASPETSIIQDVGEHLVQRKQKAQEIPQDVFKNAISRLKSRKADKVESYSEARLAAFERAKELLGEDHETVKKFAAYDAEKFDAAIKKKDHEVKARFAKMKAVHEAKKSGVKVEESDRKLYDEGGVYRYSHGRGDQCAFVASWYLTEDIDVNFRTGVCIPSTEVSGGGIYIDIVYDKDDGRKLDPMAVLVYELDYYDSIDCCGGSEYPYVFYFSEFEATCTPESRMNGIVNVVYPDFSSCMYGMDKTHWFYESFAYLSAEARVGGDRRGKNAPAFKFPPLTGPFVNWGTWFEYYCLDRTTQMAIARTHSGSEGKRCVDVDWDRSFLWEWGYPYADMSKVIEDRGGFVCQQIDENVYINTECVGPYSESLQYEPHNFYY